MYEDSPFPPGTSWVKIRRRATDEGKDVAPRWVYFTSSRGGREHATAPLERMAWPQGCDQCAQLISPADLRGVRSVRVSRGPTPTTLYLCASCVGELCRVCGVPEPEPGS
jgi:hypothetical protein